MARAGHTVDPNTATTPQEGIALRIAWVEWESKEYEARTAAKPQSLPSRSHETDSAPSSVFSVRLAEDEIAALRRRAALEGSRPSVLVRRLIRRGLRSHDRDSLAAAVEEAVRSLAEVQSQLSDAVE